MSGWGIAENAPVIEKIKAESADYLRGLNCCGEITWNVYDKAFDFYMELISRAYEQGKKEAHQERTGEWIYKYLPAKVGSKVLTEVIFCSKCRYVVQSHPSKYCPDCGRRMVGESDG